LRWAEFREHDRVALASIVVSVGSGSLPGRGIPDPLAHWNSKFCGAFIGADT
jgi:hypothetical protein